MGIPCVDHIVIGGGNGNYCSIREAQLADFSNQIISMTAEDILRVADSKPTYEEGGTETMPENGRKEDLFVPDFVKEAEEQIAKGVKLPTQEEVTIKFGKDLAEPFQSKDGREFMRISIPNQDPADKTPWASFVLPAKAASVHKRCFAIDGLKTISYNRLKIISRVGGTMTTRERIIEEALTLFAENGYDGTGVERIAERVGIKAPSLYKHFKGKEDILNAIIDEAEARYEESFGSAENTGKIPENKEEFLQITIGKVLFTMHDPMIRKIRIFLVKEQFRSERLAKINTKHQVDGLQKMYTKILTAMMEKGLLKTDDPSLLALELISPAVVLIAKADRQPECDKEVQESIEKHLRHFCDMYIKEANGI